MIKGVRVLPWREFEKLFGLKTADILRGAYGGRVLYIRKKRISQIQAYRERAEFFNTLSARRVAVRIGCTPGRVSDIRRRLGIVVEPQPWHPRIRRSHNTKRVADF